MGVIFDFLGPYGLFLGLRKVSKTVLGSTDVNNFQFLCGGGGGIPRDYLVSTRLQFCCWGCGCCWAVAIWYKHKQSINNGSLFQPNLDSIADYLLFPNISIIVDIVT